MKNLKVKTIISFILIVFVAGLDYQFFSEGRGKLTDPMVRQVGHIVILFPVALIGFFAWKNHPYAYIHRLWTISYASVIISLLGIGLLQWKMQLFTETILDQVRLVRLIFCSPLPFLFLLMIIRLTEKEQSVA